MGEDAGRDDELGEAAGDGVVDDLAAGLDIDFAAALLEETSAPASSSENDRQRTSVYRTGCFSAGRSCATVMRTADRDGQSSGSISIEYSQPGVFSIG